MDLCIPQQQHIEIIYTNTSVNIHIHISPQCLQSIFAGCGGGTASMKWGAFVPSEDIGFFPQLLLMLGYGYILFVASKTISDGSEMLLSLYGPGDHLCCLSVCV